ncbi:MAG: hypothetical protein H6Q75_277 [Firmicutes bacterium]|nr:hypothetical protein [Bacillota bacterium]
MKFAVVGSSSSVQLLKQCEGYTVSIDSENNDFNLFMESFPELQVIFVELSPAWLSYIQAHLQYLQSKPIVYFEYTESNIRINSPLTVAFENIVSNYYKVQTQTQGQIGYLDATTITLTCLNHLNKSNLDQVRALEVGSWTGCSSYFLAKAINSLGSQTGTLYCMDTWRGSEYWNYDIAAYIDIFANFRGYMTSYDVYRYITPVITDSLVGFSMMRDDFFDIIFIDGDHRYTKVYSDIKNALQKIKPGGLLMGHDCRGYADALPSEFLQSNLEKDCAFYQGKQYSCGVLKALQDFFGCNYHTVDGGSVWYKFISPEDKSALLLPN